ncbi:uncharacterized protein BDV17DRAFT_292105 [Aspergillus undulatus]|uniref:uncharacterized protein n=1 Tax=Aspergillus undulatus TaxID=1810928 RepID=UPI003CCE2BE5
MGLQLGIAQPTNEFRRSMAPLRSHLKHALPNYMIPSTFVEVSKFPKTQTGNLHRRLLRESASVLSRRQLLNYTTFRSVYRGPDSESESKIQAACPEVLHLAPGDISVDDNFLDLGGDSLLARTGFNSQYSSKCAHSSIRPQTSDLAQFDILRDEFLAHSAPSLVADEVEDVLPALETPGLYASHQVVDYFPFHLTGSLDVDRLREACSVIMSRYPILRTVFHFFRGQLLQIVLRRVALRFTVQMAGSADNAIR